MQMLIGRAALAGYVVGLLVAAPLSAIASNNVSDWPVLSNPFESTGGGGVVIDNYRPVVDGEVCRTDFTARMPDGQMFYNSVEWTAVPHDGGILCTDGKWQAKDGSASGTTPFRVFIKDGVVRRSP